jgi:DNA-directed RNA polymerase specialized sigma subunit
LNSSQVKKSIQSKKGIVMARKSNNYINNKTLYEAMIVHRSKLKESKENDKPKPQVSDYIGQAILLICNNLARKPNFSGYTYKQEMISDGIMDCISAVDNFNPDKTSNPFAYFTQIAWNAFIRRIHKEKKQTYIKHKNFENHFLITSLNSENGLRLQTNEYSDEIVKNYEKSLTKKPKGSKVVGIEAFSGDSDEKRVLSSS